jgi:hypothetical protein
VVYRAKGESLPVIPPKLLIPWAADGKEETPQRHEHEHAPASTFPVPLDIDPEAGGATAAGGAAAAGGGGGAAALAAGGATEALAAGGGPPWIGARVPVPFWATAICWNIAWLFSAVGLMEKVIPFPQ